MNWTEDDDIELLEAIVAQEVSDPDEDVDYSSDMIGNTRSREDNKSRWALLIKNLSEVRPG